MLNLFILLSSSEQSVSFLNVFIVLPFPECHVIRIIQYAVFSDWVLSLSNMHLWFFHVFSWLDNSFLFYSHIIFHWIDVPVCLSIHLLKEIGNAQECDCWIILCDKFNFVRNYQIFSKWLYHFVFLSFFLPFFFTCGEKHIIWNLWTNF